MRDNKINIVLHIPNCNGIPIQIHSGHRAAYGDKLPEKPKEGVKKPNATR